MQMLINKDKLKMIKEQIQNKFAELDFRDDEEGTLDHVLIALQEIAVELYATKYGQYEGCEECNGPTSEIDQELADFMERLGFKS